MKRLRAIPILGLALLTTGCGYNRIQELDERTEALEANIDAELLRRNDLIPNLVATVEEQARFEEETQTRVAEARAGLQRSRDAVRAAVEGDAPPADMAAAESALASDLRLFLNVSVEAYPELRANEGFLRLQDELTETENRIAVARRDYNEGIEAYNAYIRSFPQVLTAKVIGADRKEPFEAPAGAREAPRVDFDGDREGD